MANILSWRMDRSGELTSLIRSIPRYGLSWTKSLPTMGSSSTPTRRNLLKQDAQINSGVVIFCLLAESGVHRFPSRSDASPCLTKGRLLPTTAALRCQGLAWVETQGHIRSSQPQIVVDGDGGLLLRAKASFGRLDTLSRQNEPGKSPRSADASSVNIVPC